MFSHFSEGKSTLCSQPPEFHKEDPVVARVQTAVQSHAVCIEIYVAAAVTMQWKQCSGS